MTTTPKNFTEANVNGNRIFATTSEPIDAPLEWQRRGLQQTATGYGAKLTTRHKIQFEGKEYRLYATCWSNAASVWFTVKGRTIFVS